MSKLGLKLAMYEHRWESYTNYVIIVGLLCTIVAYYFRFVYTVEVGFVAIGCIGFCHLVARIGHKGEQVLMRDQRGWVKKK